MVNKSIAILKETRLFGVRPLIFEAHDHDLLHLGLCHLQEEPWSA